MARTLRFATDQQYNTAWLFLIGCTKDFSFVEADRELIVSDSMDEAVLNRLQEIHAGKHIYEV